jgi:hypothetical protein
LINHYSVIARQRTRGTFSDAWSCSACAGVLVEPVSLGCGHSACRKCLAKDLSQVCRKCGIRHRMLGDDPVNDLDSLKVSKNVLVLKYTVLRIRNQIRIRKDPKLFAGSGSVIRCFGSGSG